jgi:hypothetical protein
VAEAPHLDHADQSPPPGVPGGGGLVPVLQRIVTWDGDGTPVVREQQVFTKAQVSQIAMAAASLPYVDPNDELALALGLRPSEFYGMTNLEVMLVKQARYAAESGETDVIDKVLDRLVGKPKQSVEKHEIVETYDQALARIGRAAAAKARPIDAEIVGKHDADPVDLL